MKYRINHKSATPLHIQAEEVVRKMISAPEYQNGQLLPKEVELAKDLGISRATLRQAINKLVFEGLLVRKKAIGTRVAQNAVSSRSNNWLSFSQEMAARGIPIRNFELHITWVNPNEVAAAFFEIDASQKILCLERLRGRPEGPFVYFVSYFHPRIGLTGDEDFKRPLYEVLEKDHGVIANLSKEEISARGAERFIAQKLEIDHGAPVLVRKRFVFDQNDRPIEYNIGYYRSDSFVYTVESRRE